MRNWIKSSLVLAILGFILGYLNGPFFYVIPNCPGMECMGDPTILRIPVGIIGAIIGGLLGFIIGKKKKNKFY